MRMMLPEQSVRWAVVLGAVLSAGSTWAQTDPAATPPAPTPSSGEAKPADTGMPAAVAAAMPDAGVPEAAAPTPAAEAAPTPAPAPVEDTDTTITGTRIRRKDLASAAPLAVFSREQIQASGRTNVGEFLQTIPEFSNAINRATNNGGDGSIRLNLRGINPASTLVLLNGRRITPGGTGANASVDLTTIPSGVVERIEVLKDGASAVYGSDAVAGVVNIITRRKMNGAELNIYGSTATAGDGQELDVTGTAGISGEKGSALISANFYNGAPVWAGNRDFSKNQIFLDASGDTPSELVVGSGTIPAGRIVLSASERGVQNGNSAWNALMRQFPMAGSLIRNPDGTFRPYNGASLPTEQGGMGGDQWNFQPYNYLITPQQRFNVFSTGEYNFNPYVRVFYDALYAKRTSEQELAPEPLLTDSEGVVVSRDSIYNPFGRDFSAVRRRLLEFGGRRFTQDVNTFHFVAGLDGNTPETWGFLGNWHWETVFTFSRNESNDTKRGNIWLTRLQNAIGPSFIDGAGTPTCGTPDAPIAGCVPLNLLGGPGSITPAMVNYLSVLGVGRGYNQLLGWQANISGELFRIAAERKVALAIGYEGRVLSGGNFPDPITVAGEISGNKGLITEGSYTVNEIYGELTIPIVDKLPGVDTLELIVAGRGSFYSNFGAAGTFKVGARYRPIRDITLRGSYATAFRAPTIPELFGGQQDNFANVSDPCGTVTAGSVLATSCGAAANNGDDQTQLRSRIGGNVALRPEVASTFTVGTVLEPRFIKGLAITADYYNTNISQTVAGLGENVILQGCYPTMSGVAPKYCELITRDPSTQRITSILNLNQNVGSDALDGIDLAATYDLNTPIGRFNLLLAGTWLRQYNRTLADGTVVQGAGTWDLNVGGSAGAYPHFRFNAAVGWRYQGFNIGIRTYFIGAFTECSDSDKFYGGGGLCYADPTRTNIASRTVDAWNNWDASAGYAFTSPAGRTNITLGVTNAFNQTPPRIYNGFAGNTDTYNYNLILRTVYFRLQQAF